MFFVPALRILRPCRQMERQREAGKAHLPIRCGADWPPALCIAGWMRPIAHHGWSASKMHAERRGAAWAEEGAAS